MKRISVLLALCACSPSTSDGPQALQPMETGREYTSPTEILDESGRVQASGWARSPLFVFDRARIPDERALRTREWEFYEAHTPTHSIAVTLAKVGLEGEGFIILASVKAHDRNAKRAVSQQLTIFDAPDMLVFEPGLGGHYRVEGDNGFIAYSGDDGKRVIDFTLGDAATQPTTFLSGHLEFTDAGGDSIALVTPFEDEGLFFYEDKVPTLRASGSVDVAGTQVSVEDAPGVLDWVRAAVPQHITWEWASGADGRIALNLGTVHGDESMGTPNAIFVDGKLHKLGRVEWTFDLRHPSSPWHFVSGDGHVNLTLTGDYVENVNLDLGLFATALTKLYGTWSGSVILDDGSVIDVGGVHGAAECADIHW